MEKTNLEFEVKVNNKDFENIYKELSKPFPKEAHSQDISRSKNFPLTSIKAQWVVERLNTVLGFSGWSMSGDFENLGDGVIYRGTLEVLNIHKVEAIGYADLKTQKGNKKNIGDVYKSARTDALSKAASWIGVGNDVFKGNVDPHTFDTKNTERDTLMKEVEEAAKKATKNFQDTDKMKLIKDTLEIDGAFVAFIKQLDNEDLKGVLTVIKGME